MLVLSRKVGQSLKIGDDVTVEIVRVSGGLVRVGISAPKDVQILRTELVEVEDEEEDQAA